MSKPYDNVFKRLAETDPRGLLDVFGRLPLSVKATVRDVPRELTPPSLEIDQAYFIHARGKTWIEHFEAYTHVPGNVNETVTKYSVGLALKYRERVHSNLLLLKPVYAPRRELGRCEIELGSAKITATFNVIRVWEIDAKQALSLDRAHLNPWVPLMKATRAEIVEAAQRVSASGDDDLSSQFQLLGGLRYRKDRWKCCLKGLYPMLSERILKQSSYWEILSDEVREKSRAEGRTEGRTEGRAEGYQTGTVEGLRLAIRGILKERFPRLASNSALARIDTVPALENLLHSLVRAKNEAAAAAEIRKAASPRRRSH